LQDEREQLIALTCMDTGSEEEDDAIHISGKHGGDYVAVFDPLDGSSNVSHSATFMAS
jgi:fructose-1,6-bisphosphatase